MHQCCPGDGTLFCAQFGWNLPFDYCKIKESSGFRLQIMSTQFATHVSLYFKSVCWNYFESEGWNYFESEGWNYFEAEVWHYFESEGWITLKQRGEVTLNQRVEISTHIRWTGMNKWLKPALGSQSIIISKTQPWNFQTVDMRSKQQQTGDPTFHDTLAGTKQYLDNSYLVPCQISVVYYQQWNIIYTTT